MPLRRFFMSRLVFGFIFAAIGLALIFFLGRSITLTCTRAPNSRIACTSESKLLGLFAVGRGTIADIDQAWVDESCDDEGCTYCVVLSTSRGEVRPDTTYDSGYAPKADLAERINAFLLGSGEDMATFQFTKGFVMTVFGGLFFLAGLWVLVSSAHQGRLMEP